MRLKVGPVGGRDDPRRRRARRCPRASSHSSPCSSAARSRARRSRVGAALGGPLVVGTISYGVAGVDAYAPPPWRRRDRGRRPGCRRPRPHLANPAGGSGGLRRPRLRTPTSLDGTDTRRLARDQVWFLVIFAAKVTLGLVAFAFKPWLGCAVPGCVRRRTSAARSAAAGSRRRARTSSRCACSARASCRTTAAVVAQTLLTLVVVFVASQLSSRQLEWAGPALGLPAVGRRAAAVADRDRTAGDDERDHLGPPGQGGARAGEHQRRDDDPGHRADGLGLFFTPWLFDTPLVLAGLATIASVSLPALRAAQGRLTPGRLAAAALFYLAFAVALVIHLT